MSEHTRSSDVVIVGGGIVGLSAAWRARARGLSVTLLERDTAGRGTSYVAAGMLAPVAEAEFGAAGRRLLGMGLRSAEMWPGFAAELEETAGMEVGLLQTGTLVVARDEDEARELERQLAFRESLGLPAQRLRASAAREREPGLAPTVRLAIEAPDDHSVDPRLVLQALRRVCDTAGVTICEHTRAESVELDARQEPDYRPVPAERRALERRSGGARRRPVDRTDRGAARPTRGFACDRSRARSCACAIPPVLAS